MFRELQQVLRLVMILSKPRRQQRVTMTGGLLVLLWSETETSGQRMNCTVAAAGPWCTGIKMKALKSVLTDSKESMLSAELCPEPDPEELCAFTDLHGSLKLLLSYQIKDPGVFSPEWQSHVEDFLHKFSLVNAKIRIHFKFNQQTIHQEFRVKFIGRIALAAQPLLLLDVSCRTHPPVSVKKGGWCQRSHPVLGARLPLSIPPDTMSRGLYGELSVQLVTLLNPCVLQYPNLATRLSHIQVLVYSPSNVPVTGPSAFFQTLPAHLDCQELGLQGLHYSSLTDFAHSIVYTVEQENYDKSQQESSLLPMQQNLSIYLFLQHSDPFISQISDIMVTEELIELHLEDILNNNRRAVTTALQTELENTLKAQNHRSKAQEKLRSASEVILSSAISIVSSSSNMEFRSACLNSMKVPDTHELSASLRESLRTVTSKKFIPKPKCRSAKTEEHPEIDELNRTEI